MKFILTIFLVLFCQFTLFGIDLSEVPFRADMKVGVMIGSFDPFHEGHQESLERSIAEEGCDYVVVIPFEGYTAGKNQRTPLLLRQKMLEIAFKDSKKVIISRKTQDDIIRYLESQPIRLVGIIGSDYALAPEGLRDWIAPEWIVFIRFQDRKNPVLGSIKTILESPATFHFQKPHGYSSTIIRELIKNGVKDEAIPVDPRVLKWIRNEKLY